MCRAACQAKYTRANNARERAFAEAIDCGCELDYLDWTQAQFDECRRSGPS